MTRKAVFQLSNRELRLRISELVSFLDDVNKLVRDNGVATLSDDRAYELVSLELEECLRVADDRWLLVKDLGGSYD